MLRQDIEDAINRNSAENGSDTPDFILAEYLLACLDAFDYAVNKRELWFSDQKILPDAEKEEGIDDV